jgi:hypothetical protein
MNQVDSAHVQAALIAQGGALSALFVTHPDPQNLQKAFMEQMQRLATALEASGAPPEFWNVMLLQAEDLAGKINNPEQAAAPD